MKKNGEYVGVDDKFIPEDEKYVDESLLGNKEETKKTVKKVAKGIGIGYLVFIGIFLVIFVSIFIFIGSTFIKTGKMFSKGMDIVSEQTDEKDGFIGGFASEIKSEMNKQEVDSFNSDYELYGGTRPKTYVNSILDNVVKNNKKNKDKIITVTYNDNTTSDPDEIIELKKSFEDRKKYEIILDYNEAGLVNKIRIEDI